ncbi:glucose-6-phosphate dehydrogenase assembly protein OpcA [Agromyces flavus]|uniref:Glucose-6-phosphate dehydrogenase assembly protein OpcA n=1 Tax=Agromyces flavus TaxID=589382 RepID=A0A1H1R2Z3_9MICO|nr:glucose-6-phosphate dehydrogenase assembly protein OpcA [Agromyces flavus]MCP2367631.1 glucose-6-phosphate dehydrogenase assembly protein OpcA [Agromyces flavus]GGI47083.1 glucose-6-phosphate dehydrogenase assembly protein OpcA [Agromyces flavus]SDS29986.1 glucose-6-phosphate dehydrogenase assembly protein OpcA [Agromyces flavus]
MIVELPDTTTSQVSKTLVKIREEGGVVALGRVLTLIIDTTHDGEEEAIEAANDASREHPMRVIVVSEDDDGSPATESRIDAEIRVGGDAGASEVIILRARGDAADDEQSLVMGLLLPDAPVVTWWPGAAPEVPGDSPLGRIAQRRITDASTQPDPQDALDRLAASYRPGDADFAWTRLTLWRAQLAAVLDQPPYDPVTAVSVTGAVDSPSTTLLAAWLSMQLGAPADCTLTGLEHGSHGIHGVHLVRPNGRIELVRDQPGVATLRQPGQPVHDLALPRRSLRDCLADELRRLDPDELYGEVITRGLALVSQRAANDEGATA